MSFQIIAYKLTMKNIVLFMFLTFPALFYAQAQKYNPKVNLAIETYAFLKGQDAALKSVALQFPSLKSNIATAEKSSKALFDKATKNIEFFLQDQLSKSEFSKLQNALDLQISEQLKKPIEKEKYALDFLKIVQQRPSIITDTLLLQGIMSFAYDEAPHQEIADGHIQYFKVEDHPKAKQISLKLSLPKTWLAEEAEMPETIQQFTSYYGKGNEKFLVVVYDLPLEDHDLILSQKSISEMIPPQTKLIRTDTATIDGRPAMIVEVEETLISKNDKTKVRMLQFMFVHKGKLYCLQGSIGPVKVSHDLEHHIKKYEPLFRLIAARAQIGR